MPLPTQRTVTGTYNNPVTGVPYDGTSGEHFVIFEPVPDVWTDQDGNQILLGGGQENLDVNGSFSKALVVTDAADVLPEDGKLWRLRRYVGGEWRTRYFELPEGDGSPVDITDLLSVEVDGIEYVPVPGPEGPAGPAGQDGTSSDDAGLTTGIISGGDISINALSTSAIDISPFRALIVDYLTDPENAIVTMVTSSTTITVEMDAGALARAVTWWVIDENLVVSQQATRPTPEQRRTTIVLGVTTQSGGVLDIDQSIPNIIGQPINQLYDLMDSIGAFNISGNEITPNGVNLMLDHATGQVFSRAWNHYSGVTPTNNPHISTTQGHSPAQFRYVLRNTSVLPAPVTNVDPANYDLNGVLTPVGGSTNNATIQRIWLFPTNDAEDQLTIQYGQTIYPNLATAVSSISTASHVVNPFLPVFGVLLGFLCVRRNATDLSDTAQAQFVPAAKFGVGPASSQDALANYLRLTGGTMTGTILSSLTAATDQALASQVADDTVARFIRQADGAMEFGDGINPRDAFFERLGAGLLAFLGTDFFVGTQGVKGYRFRQSGSGLDVDGTGADLFLSLFQGTDFDMDQFNYLRLESGVQLAHAIGKWIWADGPFGAAVHTLDGFLDEVGFHGAAPVGKQIITGERSTGEALENLLIALGLRGDFTDNSTAGPLKANDADVVKLTGNQTVGGVKTFSLSPTGPEPTTDSQMAVKSYVDDGDAANSVAILAETHNIWQPEDVGLVAWTSDPLECQSSGRYETADRIRAMTIKIAKSQDVTSIVWYMLGYDGGLTAGSWAAIYNSAGNKVGTVADLTAVASEPPEVHDAGGAMSGSPLDEGTITLSPGVYTVVWRFIYNYGVPDGPKLLDYENSFGAPPNILARNGVIRCGYSTAAVTSPPATVPALNTDGGNRFWVGLADDS